MPTQEENNKALLKAVREGDEAEVTKLLEPRDSVNAADKRGQTPLHWAAAKGHDKDSLEALHDLDSKELERDYAERNAALMIQRFFRSYKARSNIKSSTTAKAIIKNSL